MKLLFNSLLIFAVILITGCSKEKPVENAPSAPAPEPVVLKKEIQTLHKAEDLKKSATDDINEQHKQIEAATQ
jgi:predicted small lipoprotein YifL